MTNGGLPAWVILIIPLLATLLPILLLVILAKVIRNTFSGFGRRGRDRARRNSAPPPTGMPGAGSSFAGAAATVQGQSPAQAGPPQTAPAAPPKDPLWEVVLFILVVSFVFVRAGIGVVAWFTPDFRMLPPSMPKLAAELPNYVEIKGLKKNLTTATLTGRAVIVDKNKASLHPLMRGLSKSIKATVPDEVSLVIWIQTERVPDPVSRITAAAKPTPEQIARWSQSRTPGSGMPMDTVAIPTYRAKWTVTVIDFKKKEIRSTHSFVGPGLPEGELDFRSPWLSGQNCLYADDKLVKGAEVIFGDKGDVFIGGKPLVGVVAPTPWDEALQWVEQRIKP